MRSGARGRQRSQRVRPLRRTDGEAGWTEPGATRWRSWLTRAAKAYTAGAAGMAVSVARAQVGADPSRRATERRQVGCGRPSTSNGWWWGVAFVVLLLNRFDPANTFRNPLVLLSRIGRLFAILGNKFV